MFSGNRLCDIDYLLQFNKIDILLIFYLERPKFMKFIKNLRHLLSKIQIQS
jgi:hypothetical protein